MGVSRLLERIASGDDRFDLAGREQREQVGEIRSVPVAAGRDRLGDRVAADPLGVAREGQHVQPRRSREREHRCGDIASALPRRRRKSVSDEGPAGREQLP
jgi:hypothetical protein